jgi:hypothetical protein
VTESCRIVFVHFSLRRFSLLNRIQIKNWLEDGFATLNVTAFSQKNVSGFETESKGYNLVNLEALAAL